MVGQIEALVHQGIDVRRPPLARTLAGMRQHALDDGVGAAAVLADLPQIVDQCGQQILGVGAPVVAERGEGLVQDVPKFSEKLGREVGEVVDEVERILDLVGDAGDQLAQERQLLRLDQIVLRPLQFGEGPLRLVLRLADRLFVENRLGNIGGASAVAAEGAVFIENGNAAGAYPHRALLAGRELEAEVLERPMGAEVGKVPRPGFVVDAPLTDFLSGPANHCAGRNAGDLLQSLGKIGEAQIRAHFVEPVGAGGRKIPEPLFALAERLFGAFETGDVEIGQHAPTVGQALALILKNPAVGDMEFHWRDIAIADRLDAAAGVVLELVVGNLIEAALADVLYQLAHRPLARQPVLLEIPHLAEGAVEEAGAGDRGPGTGCRSRSHPSPR